MVSFEDGYKFFSESAAGIVGAETSGVYVETIEKEINNLVKDLNAFESFKTPSKMLKGDIAEFWHSDTFNIKAAVNDSDSRAFVDRSHDFASTDVSSNFGNRYGLKFYSDGQSSANAQATSVFQRFKEYQTSGGKDSIDKFLKDRGYSDVDSVLNDPIYAGQIRVIPRDQLEEATKWLNEMIAKESSRRPEQMYRYEETLKMLTDRLKDSDGVESIPLSKDEAEALATLAKKGEINAEDIGLTPRQLVKFENIMQQACKAGVTAATISLMLKVAPEIYRAISYLVKNGEINAEQFKKIGFAAISGSAEGFIRGSVSSALTTCCKIGLLGEFAKSVDPTIIGTVTVLTMNVVKNAFEVAAGKKTKSQLSGELVRDMYVSALSLACGGITQAAIEIPVLGYLIGSFVGSLLGSFTYHIGQKAVISFCVDSGFTFFGLVDQDYTLPKELIKEIGIGTFDYETFDIETFQPDSIKFDTFEADTFEPNSLDITFLRRGVIGVTKVGYV